MDFVLGIGFCGAMLLAPDTVGPSLVMRVTYDNTRDNVRNPFNPPRRVRWGQNTVDEAILRFEEAIRLSPDLAYAHNSLGYALRAQGRIGEAVEQYRRAVAIEPQYAHAHNNLGVALQALGRLDAAASSYERAARLKPEDPVPRRNWAKALVLLGNGREAVAQFRLAIEAAPDWPELLGDLAWVLAAHPDPTVRDPEEGVNLARRAAALTSNQDLRILDVLSVAWAATGNFDAAGEVARSAISMAEQRREGSVAAAIRKRLRTYESSQSYVHDFVAGFGR